MTHNGFLVHPDIWMLWFSFFVACAVCVYALYRFVLRPCYRFALLTWIINR